jgi:hypothetical protein
MKLDPGMNIGLHLIFLEKHVWQSRIGAVSTVGRKPS